MVRRVEFTQEWLLTELIYYIITKAFNYRKKIEINKLLQ